LFKVVYNYDAYEGLRQHLPSHGIQEVKDMKIGQINNTCENVVVKMSRSI
jgi:hypothetical protein